MIQWSCGIYVLNFNLIGHIAWLPELFNILNMGSRIETKLGTSIYDDVIMWAETYIATLKSALLILYFSCFNSQRLYLNVTKTFSDCFQYKTHREQRVTVSGRIFCWEDVCRGVPQGSVLDNNYYSLFISMIWIAG